MTSTRFTFLLAAAFACAAPSWPQAADASGCLPREHRQAVQASGNVVPLAEAKRAVPAHKGEVVRAKLCQRQNGLVYLLTLLAQDGKVAHVAVDAGSGRLAGGR